MSKSEKVLKWLDDNCTIKSSDVNTGCDEYYASKVDGSYVAAVDDDHSNLLEYFVEDGITDVQSIDDSGVACIGYSSSQQKWYGWSHRAIYGFGIGAEVKKGDCAYQAPYKESFKEGLLNFWGGEGRHSLSAEEGESDGRKGVWVNWVYADNIPNEKLRNQISGVFTPYPEKWGRGEWTAKTINDAKQMAIDYAKGVS